MNALCDTFNDTCSDKSVSLLLAFFWLSEPLKIPLKMVLLMQTFKTSEHDLLVVSDKLA